MLFGAKKVLVVAAHPDDEVIGCGGAIAKLTDNGCEVNVAFLADGIASRDGYKDAEIEHRNSAADTACKVLGVQGIVFGHFPDNQMDTISQLEIAKTVEGFVTKFQPDCILTHHSGDLNVDHRLTHQAVVVACRPQPNMGVKSILTFEVSSSTEWQLAGNVPTFDPSLFVDISAYQDVKRAALNAYAEEMRGYPHARSVDMIMTHAQSRGASIGVEAAEAFMLGRALV